MNISSYTQTYPKTICDTITIGYPLKEALKEYNNTIHKKKSGIALIFLTLNELTENTQIYRISTFKDKTDVIEENIYQYCRFGDDFVFFSIAYNRQLINRCDSLKKDVLENYDLSQICHTDDYWELTIEKDLNYKINKKIKGHQSYRLEKKKIYYNPN